MTKTPKKKKCRWCKECFTPSNSMQKACKMDCAVSLVRHQAQLKRDKEHKERKREFRKNDVSIQRESAQRAFNAYIVARDREEGCISCDKPATWSGRFSAGHFHTVGARSDLRFNEDNTHKQCWWDCNRNKSGNIANYQPRLIEKIGQKRFDALEKVETVRYTAEDYRAIAKTYREKLKALKANDPHLL